MPTFNNRRVWLLNWLKNVGSFFKNVTMRHGSVSAEKEKFEISRDHHCAFQCFSIEITWLSGQFNTCVVKGWAWNSRILRLERVSCPFGRVYIGGECVCDWERDSMRWREKERRQTKDGNRKRETEWQKEGKLKSNGRDGATGRASKRAHCHRLGEGNLWTRRSHGNGKPKG